MRRQPINPHKRTSSRSTPAPGWTSAPGYDYKALADADSSPSYTCVNAKEMLCTKVSSAEELLGLLHKLVHKFCAEPRRPVTFNMMDICGYYHCTQQEAALLLQEENQVKNYQIEVLRNLANIQEHLLSGEPLTTGLRHPFTKSQNDPRQQSFGTSFDVQDVGTQTTATGDLLLAPAEERPPSPLLRGRSPSPNGVNPTTLPIANTTIFTTPVPPDRRPSTAIIAPTGPAMFAFLDVQSSAYLWSKSADVMREALQLYHNCVRFSLVRHNGYEVRVYDDAYMVAFSSAPNALRWAVAIQEELLTLEWPDALLSYPTDAVVVFSDEGDLLWRGLRARCGLHWGTAGTTEDPDTHRLNYYGAPITKALHVVSQTRGGQMFVSRDGYMQLATSLKASECRDIRKRVELRQRPEDQGTSAEDTLYEVAIKRLRARRYANAPPPSAIAICLPDGPTEMTLPSISGAVVALGVVGIQDLWWKAPRGMRKAKVMYHHLLQVRLQMHQGFPLRAEGDRLVAVFPSATQACEFCVDCQYALLSADWPEELMREVSSAAIPADKYPEENVWAGVKVRMGVNYGRLIREENPYTQAQDFYGPTVNKALAIGGYAYGGEIVVTGLVKARAHRFLEDDTRVTAVGWRPLDFKSGNESAELFSVVPKRGGISERTFRHPEDTGTPAAAIDLFMSEPSAVQQQEFLELHRKDVALQRNVRVLTEADTPPEVWDDTAGRIVCPLKLYVEPRDEEEEGGGAGAAHLGGGGGRLRASSLRAPSVAAGGHQTPDMRPPPPGDRRPSAVRDPRSRPSISLSDTGIEGLAPTQLVDGTEPVAEALLEGGSVMLDGEAAQYLGPDDAATLSRRSSGVPPASEAGTPPTADAIPAQTPPPVAGPDGVTSLPGVPNPSPPGHGDTPPAVETSPTDTMTHVAPGESPPPAPPGFPTPPPSSRSPPIPGMPLAAGIPEGSPLTPAYAATGGHGAEGDFETYVDLEDTAIESSDEGDDENDVEERRDDADTGQPTGGRRMSGKKERKKRDKEDDIMELGTEAGAARDLLVVHQKLKRYVKLVDEFIATNGAKHADLSFMRSWFLECGVAMDGRRLTEKKLDAYPVEKQQDMWRSLQVQVLHGEELRKASRNSKAIKRSVLCSLCVLFDRIDRMQGAVVRAKVMHPTVTEHKLLDMPDVVSRPDTREIEPHAVPLEWDDRNTTPHPPMVTRAGSFSRRASDNMVLADHLRGRPPLRVNRPPRTTPSVSPIPPVLLGDDSSPGFLPKLSARSVNSTTTRT